VLFIITQPETLSKLQSELDHAEEGGCISSPIITYEEAKSLPFLQACLKEGLRIWPPVLGLMQKTVPPAGDYLNGKFVPGGTQIGYCAWGVHRNQEIFGDDAEMFRPDRWFEDDEEKLGNMNRTHDLVFGSGRYACLGKTVAQIELSKALAEVSTSCGKRVEDWTLLIYSCDCISRFSAAMILFLLIPPSLGRVSTGMACFFSLIYLFASLIV
jgi:cytochrome P450